MTTAAISSIDLVETLRAKGWPSMVMKLLDNLVVLNVSAYHDGPTLVDARAFLETLGPSITLSEWKGGIKVFLAR